MLTPEQLAMRKTGLTASDLVTICDPPPFANARTEFDVYLDKVSDVAPRFASEAMEIGNEVEPVIVQRAAKKLGLAVVYPGTTVRHPELPLFMATPDAYVVQMPTSNGLVIPSVEASVPYNGLIEAKCVGFGASSHWDDSPDGEPVPGYVYLQVVVQMWVCKLPYVIVAALLGTEFRTHRYDWGPGEIELVEAIQDRGQQWWRDHVVASRPPSVDSSDGARRMLRGLYPRNNGVMLKADAEAEDWARQYFVAQQTVKQGEEIKKAVTTRMMERAASADGVAGDGWGFFHKLQAGYHVDGYDVPAQRKPDMRKVKAR